MKHFKGISLRLRLTLLSAAVMILVAAALTAGSISRADAFLIPDNYLVQLKEPASTVTVDQVSQAAETSKAVVSTVKIDTETAPKLSVPLQKVSLYASPNEPHTTASDIQADQTVSAETFQIDTMTLTIAAKRKFAFSSTWMMVAAMLAGVLLTWVIAGRALKPVKTLAGAIDTIDANNLSCRIENIQTHDEIRQLADSFNHMLDKLEQAFEQQRTFSANAAHELKTPLAAIRTNLEVLEMDESPTAEDYQETLEIISRNTDRLIALVSDLLELNDQQHLNFQESINTAALLEQLLSEQEAAINQKQLQVTIDNQLPTLYANRQLLASALGNLLENAVKYQHPNGQVTLSLRQQADEAIITVWDDGPGIAPDQLPYIFEPFYRCDPSRSSKISGSGLGLALVKTIVERHSGQVSVQSAPGEGTLFTITLPEKSN